jgi:hypothetical protein
MEEAKPDPYQEFDYMTNKIQERGYPGYPSSSQQDEINAKAKEPTMYGATINHDHSAAAALYNEPTVWVERISPHGAEYRFENLPNEQTIHIILEILPKALELYLKKSRDYGGNVMETAPGGDLGVKACFPDIWRKMGKLRLAIWDDQPLHEEQPYEILSDMIGHILITMDKLTNER